MNDQNKKTLRQFQCRDYLWEIFEQMSGELECSVDYLINEAMRQYARSRNYGARTGSSSDPVVQAGLRASSQPAIPSAPPPPPSRGSYPQPGQQPYESVPQRRPQAQSPQYEGIGYAAPQSAAPPQQGYPSSQQGAYPSPRQESGYGAPPPAAYPAPPPFPHGAAQGGYPPPPSGYPAPPVRSATPGAASPFPQPPPTSRPPSQQGVGPPSSPQQASMPPPLPTGGGVHPAGMATLFVIFNGQKFPVNKEEFIIGRGTKTADLAIKDGNISRRHAAIIYQNGGFYMKDLGSTNGVEYQGQRVDGRRIEEGDVYQLCDYELRFTYR